MNSIYSSCNNVNSIYRSCNNVISIYRSCNNVISIYRSCNDTIVSIGAAIMLLLCISIVSILPKFQVRCCRLNKIIKEVNFLLDPNIPSCRSWRTSLTADKFGDSMPVEVSSLTHLSFDISKYGKGDGKVVSHLSDQGSSVYLLSLWTGFQRKAEFTYNSSHMRPTSFLSERADKRSKKNAIYNKIHEIRNQKNSGSNNAGNGPGKWR